MSLFTKPDNIKLNFILTTARTGSTLLSSMLNAHPNIISTIEEPFAYYLYPKYKKIKKWNSKIIQEFCYDFYLFSQDKLEIQFGTKQDLEAILENNKDNLTIETAINLTYLCFFPNKDKSKITTIVDKQLKFHFCLKKVAKYYPQSKFIILYRDPRDNAYTKWVMFKNKKMDKELNYYRISNAWKYVYGKLNKLKLKIGTTRFLEVKYEDLVSNPEVVLKQICFFLEQPYNEEMLNYDEQIKNEISKQSKKELSLISKNHIAMHSGLLQKVNTNKIGYWKQGLKPEDANLIWTICGDLAEKIGYKSDIDFIKQKNKFKNYIPFLIILKIRLLTLLYHAAPFSIKYLIKKKH